MKVAFLGNMNNSHFAMVRYLRDRGVDADLLRFDNEPDHFHPSADSYDDAFTAYCRTLAWGNPARWLRESTTAIRQDLRDYDIVIGCGLAPAYCMRAGRTLDVFVPYGADLYYFTRYRLTYPNRLLGTWVAIKYQRRAIPQCRVFHMDMTNDLYERRWRELGGRTERWACGLPMVYTGIYTPDHVSVMADRTPFAAAVARIRAASDLLLFSHVRHVWGGPESDPDQKGTDRLFEGLAQFRQRHPGVRVSLITFEYGTTVEASKALVERLDLQDSVHWVPKGPRKDLMYGILLADIVCSEFANSWLSSGVVYEALAMGKPILGRRDDLRYVGTYPVLYPMMHATTADEICAALEGYMRDPASHREMGERGRTWYRDEVVEPVLNRYLRYLESHEGEGRQA